jgi:hypothetical protein
MPHYIIYFNQQWVGDHPAEWYDERGVLARAIVEEMQTEGVYVFAGGVDEDVDAAIATDATSGTLVVTPGRYSTSPEYLGGFTVVNVADEEQAHYWAGRVAEACGWPQETRRVFTMDHQPTP